MKINEISDEEHIFQDRYQIFKDAIEQPFFKNNPMDIEHLLVHYTHDGLEGKNKIAKHTMRYRESPRDTGRQIHNYLNYLSKQKFGVEVRSETLFTYSYTHDNGELVQSADYGKRHVVVPIGDYQLFTVEGVHDFTDHYDPMYSSSKDGYITYLFRGTPTDVGRSIEVILEVLEKFDPVGDDLIKDREHKNIAMELTTMVAEDFSHLYKSDGLETLEEELPSIVKWQIQNIIVKENNIELDSDALETIFTTIYKTVHNAASRDLNKYRDYVENMTATKKVGANNDEYMLYCKEFYFIDAQEFFDFLREMS